MVMSKNARDVLKWPQDHDQYIPNYTEWLKLASVNRISQLMGWGWHRTNNALKELGLK